MKNLKTHFKRIFQITLIINILMLTVFTIGASANDSFDYTFVGKYKEGDQYSQNSQTAIIYVQDENGKEYMTYCIDHKTVTVKNAKYSLNNLEEANYYSKENGNKIRNILSNAYPFITIDKVRSITGIKTLTEKQAILGTQAAIWHYSNSAENPDFTGNAKKLYDWYLKLPEKVFQSTHIADIDLTKTTCIANDKQDVIFSFKANGKNQDGSEIDLGYKFNTDVEKNLSAKVEDLGKDVNGYKQIKVSGLDKNAELSIEVYGEQKLNKNVFIYYSENRGTYSQNLVGIRDDSTKLSKSLSINLANEGHTLTINKKDSLEATSISNAEFEISSNKDFSKNVIKVVTGSDGKASIPNLTKGTWYIRETKAPEGYIPTTEVMEIYMNEADITLDIKNSKYGKVEVLKIDENQLPVKGAKFVLYKGEVISDENIIKTDLISDNEGKILMNDLLPGKYTLVEVEAPNGYILNNEFIVFDVKEYETTKITHMNETVGIAKIRLCKKDAVTDEQLGGTKIGIYSDEEFTNLIKEVITSKDEFIEIDLVPGTYFIKELEAPEGYLLDSAPKKVTLEKNQSAEIVFYNSKNHSTAGNYANLMIIGGTLLCLGVALITAKRILKYRSENA